MKFGFPLNYDVGGVISFLFVFEIHDLEFGIHGITLNVLR